MNRNDALMAYVLRLGDNALILGQSMVELVAAYSGWIPLDPSTTPFAASWRARLPDDWVVAGTGGPRLVDGWWSAAVEATDDLRRALVQHVREEIGPIAKPERIQFAPALPKTRSGKIMRRIVSKIAAGEYTDLGDITTLADPGVVEKLVEGHQALKKG